MSYVTAGTETEIYFEDQGAGRPIVLLRDASLVDGSLAKQVPALLDAGNRVITCDPRSFADSTGTESFSAGLDRFLASLDLSDVVLVSLSTGAGQVGSYLSRSDSARVSAAFIVSLDPFLPKTEDNPFGVPGAVFDGTLAAVRTDRYAYFDDFYGTDEFLGRRPQRVPRARRALEPHSLTAPVAVDADR